jgi:hypothetical protein
MPIALVGGTLVLCALVAEMVVRFGIGDRDYALEMWRYAHVLKRVSDDPDQVFAHSPGTSAHLMGVDVRINQHGLRGREIEYLKPAGTHRVLMLGDSLTFGWGVPEEDVTSVRLEQLLREKDPSQRWEVVNSGVGNYNTRMEVHYLEKEGLRYSPDVVVLNYFINDAEPDPRYAGNFINMHSSAWVFFANRLDVVWRQVTGHATWDDFYRGLYRNDAQGWSAARAAIEKFGSLCRAQGLQCLVVHQPELHQLKPYPFAEQEQALRTEATRAALPYLDLLPVIQEQDPSTLWVSVQDTHPNWRCDAQYASAIAQQILELRSPSPAARSEPSAAGVEAP